VTFYRKQIETWNHCIRDQVNKGRLKPPHCPTAIHEADVPTKIVKHEKFEELRNKMGVASLEHLFIYLYFLFFIN